MRSEPMYEIDHGTMPPTCFPVGMDQSNLVNVSRVGDSWARFIDTATGKEVDCAEYAEAARRYAMGA